MECLCDMSCFHSQFLFILFREWKQSRNFQSLVLRPALSICPACLLLSFSLAFNGRKKKKRKRNSCCTALNFHFYPFSVLLSLYVQLSVGSSRSSRRGTSMLSTPILVSIGSPECVFVWVKMCISLCCFPVDCYMSSSAYCIFKCLWVSKKTTVHTAEWF